MLFVLVVQMVFCLPAIAYAGEKPTIFADNIAANAGETVSIPIQIKNNTGLAGFSLEFSYNSSLLTPLSVTTGDIIQSGLDDNLEGDAVPGKFKTIWYASENLVANGILMYLNFKVADNAYNANTNIAISYSQADTFDENFSDVELECTDVSININATDYTTWYYSKLVPSTEKVRTGETLIVHENKLSVAGAPEAFTTVLTYDNSSFEFLGFANSENELVSSASAGGTVTIVYDNGNYCCQESPEVALHSAPEYYVFAVRDNAQTKTCEFGFDLNANGFEDIQTTGCTVNVQKGANYSIDIDNIATANYGDVITVPVFISNNKGIMGYSLNFEYNSTQLQPVEVTRGSGFSGSFNDSIGVEEGVFQVLWSDTENNFSNGELFTISFRVLTQETALSVVNVSYSQDDTFDEEYNDVVLACDNFQMNLNLCTAHEYEKVGECAPTCIEDGYEIYRCIHCSDEYRTVLNALGHDYQKAITKAATCEAAGEQTFTCSRCKDAYTETIPALGHDWGAWAVTTPANCLTEGVETRVCSHDAAHTETRVIAKTGHTPAQAVKENEMPATCIHTGTYEEVVYCSVCHEELSRVEKTSEKTAHQFDAVITQPTCISMGYTTHTCKNCDYSYIGDFTEMKAHTYTTIVHEPTTEEQGYTVHVCTECGYAYVDDITPMTPGAIHYIVPSLNELNITVTMKSDKATYDITSADGIFTINEVKSDHYRVYAKQKNSLTVCLGEYDTDQGEVINNDNIVLPLGDVNGDDVIDIADLSMLLANGNYGNTNAEIDLTGDGMIDISDIAVALQATNYGKSSVKVI